MDLQTAMQRGEDLSRFKKDQPVSEGLGGGTTLPTTGPTSKPATAPAAKHVHDHDDDDHKKPATPAPATGAAPAAKHDHDHDEDQKKPPAATPATGAAPAAKHDHDHDEKPAAAGAKEPAKAEGHEHHDHEEAYEMRVDGTIKLLLPKDRWLLSGVMVQSKGARSGSTMSNSRLQYAFANSPVATAISPASVMRQFFEAFLSPTTIVLLYVAVLVAVTAAISILVSIYNSVSSRGREIAIMRALGATRKTILFLICFEAGLIGLIGGLIGMVIGHGLGAVESAFFNKMLGVGINWITPDYKEWLYLGGIVALSVVAGLVPGLKAYRTPVATNLVSG